MNFTKRLIIGALIIAFVGYIGGAFMLWDYNPGNWPYEKRVICFGAVLFVILIFGGVSLQMDEESKLEKKYVDKEFEHTDNGKVRVISMYTETKKDDSTIYLISYKRLDDGKVIDEKLSEFKKRIKNVS